MGKLLLRNARIMDGTGSPWFWGDVALENGRIAEIGRDLKAFGSGLHHKPGRPGFGAGIY